VAAPPLDISDQVTDLEELKKLNLLIRFSQYTGDEDESSP